MPVSFVLHVDTHGRRWRVTNADEVYIMVCYYCRFVHISIIWKREAEKNLPAAARDTRRLCYILSVSRCLCVCVLHHSFVRSFNLLRAISLAGVCTLLVQWMDGWMATQCYTYRSPVINMLKRENTPAIRFHISEPNE